MKNQSHQNKRKYIVTVLVILIAIALLIIPFKNIRGSNTDMKDIAMEFPKSANGAITDDNFKEAQKQYHATINCFFNMATQKAMQVANTEFMKDVPGEEPENKTPEDSKLGCDQITGDIAKSYQQTLKGLLDSVYAPKQSTPSTQPPSSPETIQTCNLILKTTTAPSDDKWNVGLITPADAGSDYFEVQKATLVSPVYAVALVSNCYQMVYEQYLNKWTSTENGMKIFELSSQNRTQESSINPIATRIKTAKDELDRSQRTLDLALTSLQEFIQMYPLHTRYAAIIKYSQKVRDQMSRFRAAIDQLQYKLPNQSIEND
jgi:hypothetical protein